MRAPRRALASLVLLATALAGGPGLTFSEAWEHSHRVGPGHGHAEHYEAPGGQDHDDRCEIGLTSAPARVPGATSAELRLPVPERAAPPPPVVGSPSHPTSLLPSSRAPPPVR